MELDDSIENINDADFLLAVKQIIERKYTLTNSLQLSDCKLLEEKNLISKLKRASIS